MRIAPNRAAGAPKRLDFAMHLLNRFAVGGSRFLHCVNRLGLHDRPASNRAVITRPKEPPAR